jgi:PEP-CTERM motif
VSDDRLFLQSARRVLRLTAHAITSFGWFFNCTDCIEGAATATITNFVARTVPEPSALALIGLGLATSCFMRRRVS